MEEKTDVEKESFGKVHLNEIISDNLKEDMITNLVKHFVDQNKDPKELLH